MNVQDGTKHKTMPYRCRDCRKWFSVKTGTVMQSSKLGLQVWAVATYLLTTGLKGQASMKLHRDLGITQKSAWHLAHRIRETWAKKNEPTMAGPVEVDETYIGGRKRTSMPTRSSAWVAVASAKRLLPAPRTGPRAPFVAKSSPTPQGHLAWLRGLSRCSWRHDLYR